MNTILVVDDEQKIVDVISLYLQKSGFKVLTASNGIEALKLFNSEIDLVVLDLMLPDLSGEEVCKKLRQFSYVPIIMLTAKVTEEAILNGFQLGTDDYITKPFSPKQLVARIQAILKRVGQKPNLSGIVIDDEQYTAHLNGEKLDLTITEFKLLQLLFHHRNKVFSRDEIIVQIFGYDYNGYDRTLDSHVKNLRKKLKDQNNSIIKTVYGVGYTFGDVNE
jgi:DNA-binding response OmpR family regulator